MKMIFTTAPEGAYPYCQIEPTNLVYVRSDKVNQPLFLLLVPDHANYDYQFERLASFSFTRTVIKLAEEIQYGYVKEV